MITAHFWRWRVPDERKPGRTCVTRWTMTEAEALARWPDAVRVGDPDVRQLPESDDELLVNATGTFQHRA